MDIVIEGLSHQFMGEKRPLPVLHTLNLTIPSGQFVALVGPSGCGKSTLLRVLANLLKPTVGLVELDGMGPETAVAGKRIAWMAQNPALLPWYTCRDNVALVQQINQANGQTPDDLLDLVGIGDFAGAYPFTLSGGMQQRLALARVLAQGAAVWLMDEPFAALDELTRERLTGELLSLWRRQRPTVVWVTHHIYEAARLADRVLVMSPRPATFLADITIPLPRPRDDDAPEFLAAVRQIREAVASCQLPVPATGHRPPATGHQQPHG
jgi:NitT/TauT family transport system ATP-binding protein